MWQYYYDAMYNDVSSTRHLVCLYLQASGLERVGRLVILYWTVNIDSSMTAMRSWLSTIGYWHDNEKTHNYMYFVYIPDNVLADIIFILVSKYQTIETNHY